MGGGGFEPDRVFSASEGWEMRKRDLEAALADAERVRDLWCGEYVRVRDALAPFALNVEGVSLSVARGHITREHLLAARAALAGRR